MKGCMHLPQSKNIRIVSYRIMRNNIKMRKNIILMRKGTFTCNKIKNLALVLSSLVFKLHSINTSPSLPKHKGIDPFPPILASGT